MKSNRLIGSPFSFSCLAVLLALTSHGQISLTGTTATENFDSIGTSTTAALPSGWKMTVAGNATPSYSDAGNLTAVNAAASSGTPATGARYNWGNGTTTSDRAIGFMTSGGYASPNSVMVAYANNTGSTITALTLAFDYERYRINTAAAAVTFFYSTDGSSWTAVTAGDSGSFVTGASAYTFTGGTVVSKTGVSITGLSITPGSNVYLRWNFNTTGSNSQGLGLDNFSLTATLAPVSYSVTYNGNGNTGGTAPVDGSSPYVSGSTVTVLGAGTLTKSGYSFSGWNTAANGSGTSRAVSSTFTILANTTLYAQWILSSDTPTTTTISYDTGYSTPTTYGDVVGFEATVAPNPGAGITVTFKDGASTLGTGSTDSSGVATYATTASQLAAGAHSAITAVFEGGGGFATSTSSALSPAHVVDPKALSIGAPSIADKFYDGTTTAGVVTVGALSGFVGSETVTATATVANYASANVGAYPGNVVTYTLHDGTGGGLAANYSLATGTASGTINPRALTITASSVTKTAGTTLTGAAGSSAFSITSGSFVGSEGVGVTVTIAYGTGAAAADPLGTYVGQVIPSAATGGTFGASNYDISYAAGDIIVIPPLLAGWDFQTTGGGGTAAAAAPGAPLAYTANFGSSTLYLDGSFGSSAWTSTTPNPQVTSFTGAAVNTAETSFSTTTTSPACLTIANNSANGQSLVFKFSMTHRAGLMVSYATQGTTTGFDSHLWEYSTDGTTWTTSETVGSIPSSFATKTLATINALNGASTAYLRLTVSGATSASGNNRLDNIQLRAALVNTVPVANNDSAGAAQGTTMTIAGVKLLANDTDADGDTLTITAASAANGSASVVGGNVQYTAPGSGTSDTITYTISDGFGGTANGTINVTLSAPGQGYNRLGNPEDLGGGTFKLSYLGIPGYKYALDWSGDLSTWVPQVTNIAGPTGSLIFTNTQAGSPNFWRTRYVP